MSTPELKVDKDGTKRWYLNGKLHRTDGPAIEYAPGTNCWYVNDKLHREDGPAIERVSGSKEWYVDDKQHRVDGPAVELADGTNRWWLNGHQYSFDRYAKDAKWTDEQIVLWKLTTTADLSAIVSKV